MAKRLGVSVGPARFWRSLIPLSSTISPAIEIRTGAVLLNTLGEVGRILEGQH